MFYINHASDCFTMIDCCIPEDRQTSLIGELSRIAADKQIMRFISTHPDDDHIAGISLLTRKISFPNFYCVRNSATKDDETEDFLAYCRLRDSERAYYLEKGCKRRWLNDGDNERGGCGIAVLWPVTSDPDYQEALQEAADGGNPNNISPIISYSLNGGASVVWMGDLESDFTEKIKDKVNVKPAEILFAPHHGRASGKLPSDWLKAMSPKVVIIGEAPSDELDYYSGFNTITQNSAGDILLDCKEGKVHFYVGNPDYEVDFLDDEQEESYRSYIGTLTV